MAKEKQETIVGYKGFDKDWSCRGFKYEIGKMFMFYVLGGRME